MARPSRAVVGQHLARSRWRRRWYVPLRRNACFRRFGGTGVRSDLRPDGRQRSCMQTASILSDAVQVRSGELECATNNPAPPVLAHVSYEQLDRATRQLSVGLKAPSCVMDMPPLFLTSSGAANL